VRSETVEAERKWANRRKRRAGNALGVNQETMRVAIIKAGVILREPTKAKAPQPD